MDRSTLNVVVAGLLFIIACAGVSIATPETAGFKAYELIGRHNVFSSQRGIPPVPEAPVPEPEVSDTTLRSAINVVGIVKTENAESTFAIVEENGRHRMCRIGDIVCGMLILDICTEEVIFEDAVGPWGTHIQPPVPGGSITSPRLAPVPREVAVARASTSSAKRRLPIRAASVSGVVRTIGLVADVQEGTTRGLRLTQDFMGLQEGDCITFVGCQSLRTDHPKQKLWQIARKYSACQGPMAEIPVVIERGNREMEFVLHPFS